MVASESNGIHARQADNDYGTHCNGNGNGNGIDGHKRHMSHSHPSKNVTFDFTSQVIAATGPNAHPRLAQIMPSLLRHLHDFAREVNLTVGEWMLGVEFVSRSRPFKPEYGML
jgi:Catechol dioxygenase N terminus